MMKLFSIFATAVLSQSIDQLIGDYLEKRLSTDGYRGLQDHGCWCSSILGQSWTSQNVLDPVDVICKAWRHAKRCTTLPYGACHDVFSLSYAQTGPCSTALDMSNVASPCATSSCMIDEHFFDQLENAMQNFDQIQPSIITCPDADYNAPVQKYCSGDAPHVKIVADEPTATCEVRLVRQVKAGKNFHPATDSLRGVNIYGNPNQDGTWSIKYDDVDFDTFIFSTGDMTHLMAMTKEEIGGSFTGYYYENTARQHYKIDDGDQSWQASSAKMYHRQNYVEDPWLSINHHFPRPSEGGDNLILYGEGSYGAGNYAGGYGLFEFMEEHGGLKVFILTKGSFEDCIQNNGVGYMDGSVYVLNEEKPAPSPITKCTANLVRQVPAGNRFHDATDNLVGSDVYGTPHQDTTAWSKKYNDIDFETFIFTTGDMTHFLAMTKEEVGGSFTNNYYENSVRTFYKIEPTDQMTWKASSAKMYNRENPKEDPWLSINNHFPRPLEGGNNLIMYGEGGYSGSERNHEFMRQHSGLKVYILTEGTIEDCIQNSEIKYVDDE